jgi:F420-non-reducing hydrogenase iron-sulfur subunit
MGVDALVRKVLEDIGIRKERYALEWASAAEAPRFVRLITQFTERIRELGPLGLDQEELQERLEKALAAVSDQKLRVSFGNASKAVRKDAIWTREHIDGVIISKVEKTLDKVLTT